MATKTLFQAGLLCTALMISACDRGATPKLLNIKSGSKGPDEFLVLPNKPLTMPKSYNALPAPTPGGTNRTDATPVQDATLALGGNPNGGLRDGALVNYASRFGVAPDIRRALAREDLKYRRKNNGRLLERAFNVNVYYKAYRRQSLNQHAELERLRRRGIRTVSAPPRSQK